MTSPLEVGTTAVHVPQRAPNRKVTSGCGHINSFLAMSKQCACRWPCGGPRGVWLRGRWAGRTRVGRAHTSRTSRTCKKINASYQTPYHTLPNTHRCSCIHLRAQMSPYREFTRFLFFTGPLPRKKICVTQTPESKPCSLTPTDIISRPLE